MVPNHKKIRDMKKEAKVEFGITIVKPWSKEMYDHNDAVAEDVRGIVLEMWEEAINEFQDDMGESFMSDVDWISVPETLKDIQTAITCYGFGYGYDVAAVSERVLQDLEDAPYFRLKDIVDELGLELEIGFVGF